MVMMMQNRSVLFVLSEVVLESSRSFQPASPSLPSFFFFSLPSFFSLSSPLSALLLIMTITDYGRVTSRSFTCRSRVVASHWSADSLPLQWLTHGSRVGVLFLDRGVWCAG